MTNLRVGHGYDVHQFVDGRPFILGGIQIPYDRGLYGHSDADCLAHAIIDALLGASGEEDIGHLYPDDDDSYLNISSMLLLQKVGNSLRKGSWQVVNIDCTVIAQDPKIGPYREAMRQSIASNLGISMNQVNIKATTEEHLGFTGQGLGVAVHCVALIEKV